ncbi:MAG: hypothetical protein WCA35_16910, partial [Kovacikia sp.]
LDASKGDIFGSYPPIQMVAEPNLPETGVIPRRVPYFRVSVVLTLLAMLVLLGFWLRKMTFVRYLLHRHKLSG